MSTDSMYLDNLDEYVNDENRVVTYKWLSRTLGIHVNVSKQLLYEFLHIQRNEKDNDLSATYFVAGTSKAESKAEKGLLVQVVPEEMLDTFKSTLATVLSCHIYSVHKTKLKDAGVLYNADYDLQREHSPHTNKFSGVQCVAAKSRSDSEVNQLRSKAQPTTKAPNFSKDSQNGTASSKSSQPGQQKKSTGIANMFAKAPPKKTPDTNTTADKTQKEKTEEAASKSVAPAEKTGSSNRLKSLFSKQANQPKQVEKKKTVPESKQEEPAVTKPAAVNRKEEQKPQQRSKKQKKDADDEDESLRSKQKKRRRIQEKVWDSSSEEEEMEIESPLPSPPPPEAEPAPSPPPQEDPHFVPESPLQDDVEEPAAEVKGSKNGVRRRKHKRRLVSKHTVTPEGYMQTEKVWEDYSTDASEGPDEAPPSKSGPTPSASKPQSSTGATHKTEKKSPPQKKKGSPQKSKQMSLTNFFKKK